MAGPGRNHEDKKVARQRRGIKENAVGFGH
jgi:hypothetical protein